MTEIAVYSCENAREFLAVLSPRGNLWEGTSREWIFRGQGNAKWSLQPKAARDIAVFKEFAVFERREAPQDVTPIWSRRRDLIDDMLEQFRDYLDRSGIVIPSASPEVTRRSTYSSGVNPDREVYPLMALAQHHGLPTLLLDWSRRAWVAAYFAAVQALDQFASQDNSDHIVVWALCRKGLRTDGSGLFVYEAPGGTNPNLRAQSGLFTILSSEIDETVEDYAVGQACPRILRVHLPRSQASTLLELLADEGIHGASLFPGTDGVVKAMKERALWACHAVDVQI